MSRTDVHISRAADAKVKHGYLIDLTIIRIRIRDSLKYPGQNGNKTCSGFFRGSQDFQIETNTVLNFGDFGCIPAFAGSHINIEYTIKKVPKFVVYKYEFLPAEINRSSFQLFL